MEKNIRKFLESTKKKNDENKLHLKQLREVMDQGNVIKTGGVDAFVIPGKKELKVYTEETSDKTYRILIEKMNEGAVTLNEQGTILYCNSYFANLVNLPLQKVPGTAFKTFIIDSSKQRFASLLEHGRENAIKEEIYIISSDSRAIPVLMSVNSFPLGDMYVITIIVTDLTIQNKIREQLRFRSGELQQKNIELERANKVLNSQKEEKEKQAAELTILTGNLKEQKDELGKANDELYEKASLLQKKEEQVRMINNDLLLLNQHLENRVLDRTSELEKLNQDLKDLNLSKDKFLSVISHDLRNPLSALLMSVNVLSSNTEGQVFREIQPLVKIIDSTSNRILQQLNELLEWAQMQQQKTILNPKKINLAPEVDKSLELLKEIATQKNVVLENKVPSNIYVNADKIMIRSIIQNLVTNAIKYTPQYGLITIIAQSINKMVEVCITDSGIGMDQDTRENLFTNNNSTPVSGTNKEKGTGLGLMLVKDFVTKNGGTIRVESEIGRGASFIFTLPGY